MRSVLTCFYYSCARCPIDSSGDDGFGEICETNEVLRSTLLIGNFKNDRSWGGVQGHYSRVAEALLNAAQDCGKDVKPA